MARLLCVLFVVIVGNSLCRAASVAENPEVRNKRTSTKVGDLKNKLTQLKQLLDDIEKDKKQTTPAPAHPAPTQQPAHQAEEEGSHPGDKTLSPEDMLLLKGLKAALENMRSEEQPDKKEILQKVVYRLLSDLDLALRNGISVEDIIKYLYETEQAARQRQQRGRIEDEERQLRALLNREPAPRD